jgi:hypothetical protein
MQMNQCLRPLKSSTDSNLVDLGRCSAGTASVLWRDRSDRPQTDGRSEASANTAMYPKRNCRGVAGHLPRQAVIGERGNRAGGALAPQGEGRAHGQHMLPARDGVPVVVRGRESRPQGEGGQQAAALKDGRSDDAE